MKKIIVGLLLGLALIVPMAIAAPAGANDVISSNVNCERAVFTYADFPETPVDIYVSVVFGPQQLDFKQSTDGVSGEIYQPLDLQGEGTAQLHLSWDVDGWHSLDSSFDIKCGTPETTTTTTTNPPPTIPPTVPPEVPTTAPPANPEPPATPVPVPEMPHTGGEELALVLIATGSASAGYVMIKKSRKKNI